MRKLPRFLLTVTLLGQGIFPAAAEVWYAPMIATFAAAGYINEGTFIPGDNALRAEFVDLTLRLLGGEIHTPLGEPVFDDIDLLSPFFTVFQEGANSDWVLGVGSCKGNHPCMAAPLEEVNRAEAAALIVRAFRLTPESTTPVFSDNLPGQWYTELVDAASSRCILQGDDGSDTVRPGDSMNRAEMLAMLTRAMQKLSYPDCASGSPVNLPVRKDFILIQPEVNLEEALSSASAAAALSSSLAAQSSNSSLSSSSAGSSVSASSVSSGSSGSSSSALSGSSSSSRSSSASAGSSDDLLARYQQYVTQLSSLIVRARAATGSSVAPLVTQVRSQVELLNQLAPYVVASKNRNLDPGESADVQLLERRIVSGFAQ